MFRRLHSWLQGLTAAESTAEVHPALLPPRQPLSVEKLCEHLASGGIEERRLAAYDLGNHAGEPSAGALIRALHDDDRQVQIYAIQSLKKQHAREAVEPICRMLASGSANSVLVSNICSFLAELRDLRAIPALLVLMKSSDAFARYDAAFALGEIGDPSALPHLRELTTDHTMPHSDEDDVETMWSVGENAQIAIDKILANRANTPN